MAHTGDYDMAVLVVSDIDQADQSVFVVNEQVVAGSPAAGTVPVVQADGSLAWGTVDTAVQSAVIRRQAAAMVTVIGT